ncbi:MAG: hypothetical protein ACR2M7_02690 [Bdellovibrionales bacterium]
MKITKLTKIFSKKSKKTKPASAKKKVAAKAKPAPKKKVVAKAKPAPKKKVVAKAKSTPKKKVVAKKTKPAHAKKKVTAKAKSAPKKKVAAKAKPAPAKKKLVAKAKPAPAKKPLAQKIKPAVLGKKDVKAAASQKIKAPKKPAAPKVQKISAKLASREKELEDLLNKENEDKMILRDMQGRSYCSVESCDSPSVVDSYCRLHYFAGWKIITQRKKLLEDDFLEKFLSKLVDKYSLSILDYMFKDLSSDKNFFSVVKKLEEDGDFDIEDENLLNLLEK